MSPLSKCVWPGLAVLLAVPGCKRPPPPVREVDRPNAPLVAPGDDPPVAINANTPLTYPPALLQAGIEGTVLIRLFVDEHGTIQLDSTRIAESSGYPALDSAALAAAPKLRYAPAMHEGTPVAAPFLQPFQFRNPARTEITP